MITLNKKQKKFVKSNKKQLMVSGLRGAGSTTALLLSFIDFVDKGYGDKFKGIIFKHHYNALGDLIKMSKKIVWDKWPDAKFHHSRNNNCKWVFPDGEELIFGGIHDEEHYNKYYHGQEYNFIGIDSAEVFEPQILELIKSIARGSSLFRISAHPYGIGRDWLKENFVEKENFIHLKFSKNPGIDHIPYAEQFAELKRSNSNFYKNYPKL